MEAPVDSRKMHSFGLDLNYLMACLHDPEGIIEPVKFPKIPHGSLFLAFSLLP